MASSRPPLLREDLDRLLAGGCSTPGCKCNHGPLFLNPTCCPAAYLRGKAISWPQSFRLECSECGKAVTTLRLDPAYPVPAGDFQQSPCCESALEASYVRGSGMVVIRCSQCGAEVLQLRLATRWSLMLNPAARFSPS